MECYKAKSDGDVKVRVFISTTTPLSGGATYNSGSRLTDRTDRIVGTVIASHAGTLFVEQSYDETNWDYSISNSVSGGTGEGFSEEIVAPYVRLRYVNGGTPQTTFRLSARSSSAGDS